MPELEQIAQVLDELAARLRAYAPPEPPPEPDPAKWLWPVIGIPMRITQRFNSPVNYANGKHEGIDMDCWDETTQRLCAIVAANPGTVQVVNRWDGTRRGWQAYGNYVRVLQDDGYTVQYSHMSRIAEGLAVGVRVERGAPIGVGGNTGNSVGAHLHFDAEHPSAPPVYIFQRRCVNPTPLLPPVP